MLALYARGEDHYARIKVEHGDDKWVVIKRTAHSQALGKMTKDEFQKSKQDVLDLLESMLGVPLGSLRREAGRAA